jgi:hypothetical protein
MIGWLMNMEQLTEWELAGGTEVLRENLPQCHFIRHKSHMTWPDLESKLGRHSGKVVTNCLSYGIAFLFKSSKSEKYYASHCVIFYFCQPTLSSIHFTLERLL